MASPHKQINSPAETFMMESQSYGLVIYFTLTGKKFRGNQGGRSGGGRGRGKRRSFDRQQNKPGQEKDDETQKATHTRFDDGEPAEKKVKTEED